MGSSSAGLPWELSRMKNRAFFTLGLRLGSVFLGLFAGVAGANPFAAGNAAAPVCTSCHEQQGQKLGKSARAELSSDPCPEPHEKAPPPPNTPKPVCVTCHADQAGDYEQGVHGQARKAGNEAAPDCSLCHGGAHELLAPKSQAFRLAVPDTCGMCHTLVVEQFRSSVHGTALARGITQAPLCTDCHGEHKILKHTNTASPVNVSHIRDTCGKCHAGAGTRFAISQVHVAEGATEPEALKWVRQFYLLIIPVTIGLMMLHQGGDWIRKLIRLRFRTQRAMPLARGAIHPDHELRMLPFERIQHAVLAISFLTLVWTGFALKYPDQWWADR